MHQRRLSHKMAKTLNQEHESVIHLLYLPTNVRTMFLKSKKNLVSV